MSEALRECLLHVEDMSNPEALDRFLSCLKHEVLHEVIKDDPQTLYEACASAIRYGMLLIRTRRTRSYRSFYDRVEDPLSSLRFAFFAHALYLNGKHQLIRGRPWMNQYNPQIDWPRNTMYINNRTLVAKRKNCETGFATTIQAPISKDILCVWHGPH